MGRDEYPSNMFIIDASLARVSQYGLPVTAEHEVAEFKVLSIHCFEDNMFINTNKAQCQS